MFPLGKIKIHSWDFTGERKTNEMSFNHDYIFLN